MHAMSATGRETAMSNDFTGPLSHSPARLVHGDGGRGHAPPGMRRLPMLLAIASVLGILWLLGFTVFDVTSHGIHVLILVAVVVLVIHLWNARRLA
jgi:hypothetical protein